MGGCDDGGVGRVDVMYERGEKGWGREFSEGERDERVR